MRGVPVVRAVMVVVGAGALLACSGPDPSPSGSAGSSAVVGTDRSSPAGTSSSGRQQTGKTTTPTPAPVTVQIGGDGDLLTHVAVRRSAESYAGSAGRYDFRPMFAEVRAMLRENDVSICHMETPLTSTDTDLSRPGVLVFNTPHEILDAVKDAGYDGCDFASNHTWDMGLAGLRDTLQVFDDAGVAVAGPGGTRGSPRRVATYDVSGVEVAHLAYTYTIFNTAGPDKQVPAQAPWLSESLWPTVESEGILRDAKQARADGADFVVVSMHWGQEYVLEPTADQTRIAHDLLESSDVDLILGTHAHRVQPCSKVNDKFVFYGLGNFLSNQSPQVDASLLPQTQEGVHVQVALTRKADGTVSSEATYQPTRVDLAGHVVRLATKAGNRTTYDRVTKALRTLGDCPVRPAAG